MTQLGEMGCGVWAKLVILFKGIVSTIDLNASSNVRVMRISEAVNRSAKLLVYQNSARWLPGSNQQPKKVFKVVFSYLICS